MATGPNTLISDVIVPEKFTAYIQQETKIKSRLIRSGALVVSELLGNLLSGGGISFHIPSFRDLDEDADRVSTDTAHAEFTGGTDEPDPYKIETSDEVAVRLNRNGSWASSTLAGQLAGSDPMGAIADRVVNWWDRRIQDIWISTMTGVFADNAAAPTGADTHLQNDMTVDISGSSYIAGTTDFSAEAFIDAVHTSGDSEDDLSLVMVHSTVKSRMEKNDLLDFVKDSLSNSLIPFFRGRMVIVDDRMPSPSAGVFESWFFGPGATMMGMVPPPRATAIEIKEGAGNGSGQEILYSRNQLCIHPVGHAYIGTASGGGPANTLLDDAASWRRVYPERKQIQIARLITRES